MTDSRNIGQYSRLHSNPAGSGLVDGVDFPHSGILKAMSVGLQNSYAILNGTTADATKNFSIVQTDSSGNTQFVVRAGRIVRDGKLMPEISTSTFTQGTPSSFDEPTSGNAYFLLVATNASTNVLAIRGDKATVDVVPQLETGDIPIAILRLDYSGTVDNRSIQYLTTAKSENSVSIGFDAGSTTYTEVSAITGTDEGLFISGIGTATVQGADKVLIQDTDATGVNDVIKTVTAASIAALAPQGDITGVDLSEGTGIDIASEANTASGAYSATINLNLTEITVGAGLDNPAATTLNLDLTEVIASDGANRVLTSDGDGTLTAEADLTVNSGVIGINKSLILSVAGATDFEPTVVNAIIDKSTNSSLPGTNQLLLPSAASVASRVFRLKNIHANNPLIVTTQSGEKFDHNLPSTDVRWNSTSQITLKPLQTILLQAVTDSVTVPLQDAIYGLTPGYLILDTAPKEAGDITEVAAGTGLTGGSTSGVATLNVIGGDGITANADEIEVAVDDTTIELSANSGSGTVRVKDGGIATAKIADDAVTGAKLANNIDIAGTLDVTGVTTLDDNLVVATAKTLLARRLPVVALTASTTLSEATHAGNYVFVTGSSIVITLPDNQGAGVHFTIINNDGNGFTLRTGGGSSAGDNMNGAQTDIAVAARNGVTCISTGTDYVVLGV